VVLYLHWSNTQQTLNTAPMGPSVISEMVPFPNPVLLAVADHYTVPIMPNTTPELTLSELSLVGINAIWFILKFNFFACLLLLF